jgi:hypothetical protein
LPFNGAGQILSLVGVEPLCKVLFKKKILSIKRSGNRVGCSFCAIFTERLVILLRLYGIQNIIYRDAVRLTLLSHASGERPFWNETNFLRAASRFRRAQHAHARASEGADQLDRTPTGCIQSAGVWRCFAETAVLSDLNRAQSQCGQQHDAL